MASKIVHNRLTGAKKRDRSARIAPGTMNHETHQGAHVRSLGSFYSAIELRSPARNLLICLRFSFTRNKLEKSRKPSSPACACLSLLAKGFLRPPVPPTTLSEVRGLEACRFDLRRKRFVAIHRTERSSIGRPLTQFCSQARIARRSRAGSCRG